MLRSSLALTAAAACLAPATAVAIPAFARQYTMTCAVCHAAVPRLNAYGQDFADAGMRLPQSEAVIPAQLGDPDVAIPAVFPLAARLQAFVQVREGEHIDETGEVINSAPVDFQAPYQVKVLSGAALTSHLSYYAYAILAEKGGNGVVLLEDAWLAWTDLLGSGIDVQIGQFQVSDLMFPREVRLTFQDYFIYRMAGITYDRGLIVGRDVGPVSLELGAVNGNGITESFPIDAPGLRRPDRLFDSDGQKSFFGRAGVSAGPVQVGVFGLLGERPAATGALAADDDPDRDADVRILAVDARALLVDQVYVFAQGLYNEWDGILVPGRTESFWGGFAGVDYIPSKRWAFSLLYNHVDEGEFEDSGTIYEGLEARIATATVAFYVRRNIKVVAELNVDLLPTDDRPPPVGHLGKEGAVLLGLDAAF